nr:HNH endonuclease [Ferrimonas balearica]
MSTGVRENRVGQPYFRAEVIEVCHGRCVVTGIPERAVPPSILRASHIKPWSKSDDVEKLDGHNGLLLAPHIDTLFDSGLVTFSEEGQLLASAELDPTVFSSWGVDPDKLYTLTEKQREYMKYHRKHIFEQWRSSLKTSK